MTMSLPVADPQFWIVTGGAALALAYAIRRIRRRTRRETAPPCDRCPQPGRPLGRGAGPRRVDVLLLALLAGAVPLAAVTVERQVAAMGTTLRIEVEIAGDRAEALAMAEAMIDAVAATEARLSTWRDTSELARINRAPVGEWVETDAYDEVSAAAKCWRETDGAFHPALGRLVKAWDLRGTGKVPTDADLAAARAGLADLGLEADGHPNRVRRTAEILIEEGGFGKGAGLDAALDALERLPLKGRLRFVRLDLGGQMAWASAGHPVTVDLADPRDRSRPVLGLANDLRRASLASSSNSEKRFTFHGKSFGHVLDPRTGSPSPDFGSVAVVAETGLDADCLSTALFVMGPEEGMRWLAGSRGAVEAIFLVVDGERLRARLTPGLTGRVRPLVADLEIEVLNGSP